MAKAPDNGRIEKDFAAVVAAVMKELRASKTEAADKTAWKKAIKEYGRLKVLLDGDANENIVHFFAVDGIGLEVKHPIVFKEVEADAARKDRWMKQLQSA